MASGQLAAGLNYLTDAAHLLRGTAPEASAHLMRHRADLLFHNGLAQHELQRQHVCAACGHIMVPGQETTLKLEAHKALRKIDRRKQSAGKAERAQAPCRGPSKALTCGRCRRVTRIGLQAPEPAIRRRAARLPATKKTEAPEAPKVSANASSKKRAKNRKGGLQALLSGQQQKSASSLTLADFMTK